MAWVTPMRAGPCKGLVLKRKRVAASVSAVARHHNIAPSLLFRWRRQFAAKTPSGPAVGDRTPHEFTSLAGINPRQ